MFCGAQVSDTIHGLTVTSPCGEDAIVGWGSGDQLVWLCLIHFDEALRLTSEAMDAVRTGGRL